MWIFTKKPHIRFVIKIADIPIAVNALYRNTKKFCGDYLTDETPVVSVSVNRKDLIEERKRTVASDFQSFFHSNIFFEQSALLRKLADCLTLRDIVLFHGSVVAINGKAYLFTAKSGTGKTTHSLLWLKNIPGSSILNGDKPFILFRDDGIYACGSPWKGKERYGMNEILPLEAICLLERNPVNRIEEIRLSDAFGTLINQCYHNDGSLPRVLGLFQKFSSVKFYRLGCNMEDEAARVAYHTMVK